MRLTLRTLMAYLDDQMDPADIKQFGQRVAESDAAQELIARIRQITRRRRLTTPPATGPGSFDPNTVAEYLDNVLPPDQVSDLEKTCLDSDVHLAEIAACHQILTLVLGQPALVPATAKERMYGLFQGREAIASRKANNRRSERSRAAEEWEDENDDSLLTPPGFRKSQPWLRWALPLAGLFLLIVVGFGLLYTLPSPRPKPTPTSMRENQDRDRLAAQEREKGGKKEEIVSVPRKVETPDPSPNKPGPVIQKVEKPNTPGPTTDPKESVKPGPRPEEVKPVEVKRPPQPPSKAQGRAGVYDVGMHGADAPTSILVQKRGETWKRIVPNKEVVAAEPLVALPGCAGDVKLDSDVKLTLRGNLPEFSLLPVMNLLTDSAVILHRPAEFDADLTFLRGRVYIANGKPSEKGAARVRLRFNSEVWDLTLPDSSSEVCIDLLRLGHSRRQLACRRGAGQRPVAVCPQGQGQGGTGHLSSGRSGSSSGSVGAQLEQQGGDPKAATDGGQGARAAHRLAAAQQGPAHLQLEAA